MKSLSLIFCALFALCVLQTTRGQFELNLYHSKIKESKIELHGVINNLTLLMSDLRFELQMNLTALHLNSSQLLSTDVNRALAQIRSNVSAAKAEGKVVKGCYGSASTDLTNCSKAAFKNLDRCVDNGLHNFNPVLREINETIWIFKKVDSELDRIFVVCNDIKNFTLASCIIRKLLRAVAPLDGLQVEERLEALLVATLTKVYDDANKCNSGVLEAIDQEVIRVTEIATNCIRD